MNLCVKIIHNKVRGPSKLWELPGRNKIGRHREMALKPRRNPEKRLRVRVMVGSYGSQKADVT